MTDQPVTEHLSLVRERMSISIVLAGGGSAGHTSPLIATAQELSRLAPEAKLTVVGTARGLETEVIPAAGLELKLISPVPMPRKPGLDLAKVPARLLRSIGEAADILREAEADVVLGFGGYVSTPVYLAARRLKIPVVIHEQNVLPGLANKVATRFASKVAVAFAETPMRGATFVGLPLRREISTLDRAAACRSAREGFDLDPALPILLVSGGSQGARRLNQAVLGARDELLAAGIQILHVLGGKNLTDDIVATDDPTTGARYRPLAYAGRMEDAYAAADLMLGRSGASTVLETAVVGLPAIFVPLPFGNGEQEKNAAGVVAAGGGILLPDPDCTSDWLLDRVPALLHDRDRLAGMSAATRGVAHPDAATRLAEITLEVATAKVGRDGSH